MPRAIGAKAKLRTRPEATYGVAPSGNWTQLPFKSFELGASQELLDDPVLGAGDRRTTGDPALDTVTVEGSAVAPVDLVNFGHWLRLLLGPPTTTGTGPDYVHSFKDGAYGLPSNAFELDFVDPLPNRYSLLTGVKANELQLDFSPTGPADATIALLGQGETRAATSAAGTPVFTQGSRFQKPQGSIKRNGSSLANVTAAEFTWSNGMEAVKTIRADRRIEGVDEGLSSARGTLTLRFAETGMIDDAIGAAPSALELAYTAAANRALVVTFPRVFLSVPRTPVSGPQGVEISVDFRAADDSTAACLMHVVLKNQVASYA